MGTSILKLSNIRKTIHYLQKNGIRHTLYAAKERIEEEKTSSYSYTEPSEAALKSQRTDWKRFPYRFSIVVPAYETKEEFLREMIDSVRRQSYERWELVIADASAGNQVEEIVAQYQENGQERRIRYLRLMENRGISENTNAGIEMATGDYIGLLDHDDFLAPDALYEIASAIHKAEQDKKTPVLIYSDEDKVEKKASATDKYNYKNPNLKYEFNLDLMLSNNYICHFMMIESGLIKTLKLRRKFDGAQDYDLALRVIDRQLASVEPYQLKEKIIHVPKVLYHWRCHEKSTAENTASKTYAYEAGKAALEEFCRRRGWNVEVTHSLHLGFYQIAYFPEMLEVRPDVGIIGGRILDMHNKITSGIYDEKGKRLYQGIHKEYSGGSTHRAVLMQDCMAVDIRCMRVRRELQPLFGQITGIPYQEVGEQKLADVSAVNCDEEGYRKLSMEFGRAAAQMGYLVVWDPRITIKR